MTAPAATVKVLDREFLGIRCRLIELAAALDRIARAERPGDDPRMAQILRGLEVLADNKPDRAQRVQMAFSLPYEEGFRDLGI